ncbi:hypothetical protein LJC58_10150, partial [Lachnospiraceae bacterium OttesenSCG-928-D06]|nr:hypothetical protein [Lachnospiraceae bacterium OttesenSCG-928-D06]
IINYTAGNPIISFFGHNEYESGIFPYTRNSRQFHSPIFRSSLEALQYLSLISLKNSWNLIYRPHPTMVALGHCNESPYAYVSKQNLNHLIDRSDVIVTILSQTAYIALIRDKPVVMLGYNQLRGKGCTYEAFNKELIEETIITAIDSGYQLLQKQNFILHCTELLETTLYDDMTKKKVKIGRNLSHFSFEK